MRARGHIPVRTCISCGTKRPKSDLIRLAADNKNRLVRDNSCRIKGRGAYVCDAQPCLERLLFNKRLNRHFRTEAGIDVTRELIGMPFDDNWPTEKKKAAVDLEELDG
jgi:predicted RNA-binding protein YlxR (DUF448 family)